MYPHHDGEIVLVMLNSGSYLLHEGAVLWKSILHISRSSWIASYDHRFKEEEHSGKEQGRIHYSVVNGISSKEGIADSFMHTTYANWKATLVVIFIYHRLKTKELMFWEWFHGLLGCLNHYILHSKYFVQRFLKKVDFFLEHLMVVVTDCRFGPCC